MKIFIEKDDKQLVLKGPLNGLDILKELGINSASVILVKNDEIILDDETINDDDELKILSVISGG